VNCKDLAVLAKDEIQEEKEEKVIAIFKGLNKHLEYRKEKIKRLEQEIKEAKEDVTEKEKEIEDTSKLTIEEVLEEKGSRYLYIDWGSGTIQSYINQAVSLPACSSRAVSNDIYGKENPASTTPKDQ